MEKNKLDSAAIAELASQMGANSNTKPDNSNVSRLPQLVINSQVDDDEGNSQYINLPVASMEVGE